LFSGYDACDPDGYSKHINDFDNLYLLVCHIDENTSGHGWMIEQDDNSYKDWLHSMNEYYTNIDEKEMRMMYAEGHICQGSILSYNGHEKESNSKLELDAREFREITIQQAKFLLFMGTLITARAIKQEEES